MGDGAASQVCCGDRGPRDVRERTGDLEINFGSQIEILGLDEGKENGLPGEALYGAR